MNCYGKNIFVYNEYWEYDRTITPSSVEYPYAGPTYSINVNGMIYVATNDVINKYDKYLNLLNQVNCTGGNRGIYYSPSNQLIYVAKSDAKSVNVFDKDLNLKYTLSTSYFQLFIAEYNDQMVGSDISNGNLYFYQNNSIVKTVSTLCNRINSILFDNYNHILVLCDSQSTMYIYHVNGSYSGLSMSTCNLDSTRLYMNFDSKDRLVITCLSRIEIYY